MSMSVSKSNSKSKLDTNSIFKWIVKRLASASESCHFSWYVDLFGVYILLQIVKLCRQMNW